MKLEDVELRRLPTGSLNGVATVLEINDDWKTVMSFIPVNPKSEDFIAKYNNEHIRQIEDHARATNKKCAEVLFEEWGSSGRIRPTLKTLQTAVEKAQVLRAADDIAQLLGEPKAVRPTDGPGKPVPLDITALIIQDMKSIYLSRGNTINSPIPKDVQIPSEDLPYEYTLSSNDIPNIPEFNGLGDKRSAKTKSESYLSEYSDELIKNFESKFQPDIRDIMGDSTASKEAETNIYEETCPEIEIDPEILDNSELVIFPYEDLVRITKRFAENVVVFEGPPQSMAGRIGSGGFADVYVGYHHNYGNVAVKKLKPNRDFKKRPDICKKIFNSEIKFLSLFKHTNIVHIIGYSIGGSSPCIVCEYVEGGTLEKKLEEKTLNEKQRINIMIGVAEALKFLHSNKTVAAETGSPSEKNFVHGDVKTANILLTTDYVPNTPVI